MAEIIPAGWLLVNPAGNIIGAARTPEELRARTGIENMTAGTAGTAPDGIYAVYQCDRDIVDYFRLHTPRHIQWEDIEFIGPVARMRITRPPNSRKMARTIHIHPHAYYRIQSLTDNRKMASFLDVLIDTYLEVHPELIRPEP